MRRLPPGRSAPLAALRLVLGLHGLHRLRLLPGQIAAPRTLGELRKHYHKTVSEALRHELAKDLTGHSTAEIQAALVGA